MQSPEAQNGLQNYNKKFKYTNILRKKINLLVNFDVFGQNSCNLHDSANVISGESPVGWRSPKLQLLNFSYFGTPLHLHSISGVGSLRRYVRVPQHICRLLYFFTVRLVKHSGLILKSLRPRRIMYALKYRHTPSEWSEAL